MPINPGQRIGIRALKSSGKPYRWWEAAVESCDSNHVTVLNETGEPVNGSPRGWTSKYHIRTTFWFGRPYNLVEMYKSDGRLKQLYVHIASPPRWDGDTLVYRDLELDVIKRPGQPIRVADEDEFQAAALEFGYSPDFQDACRRAVEEAICLVENWRPAGWLLLNRGQPSNGRAARRRSTVHRSTPKKPNAQ